MLKLTKSEDPAFENSNGMSAYVAEWMPKKDESAEDVDGEESEMESHPGHGLLMKTSVGDVMTLAGGWGIEGDEKSDDGSGSGGGVEYEITMNDDGSWMA